MTATDWPSGLMRGFSYSESTSSSRIRRSPVATSMSASPMRSPPRSRTSQVVTIVEPSRLTSYSRRSSARPASGVRSLRSIFGSAAVSSSASRPVKMRGAPGPRSSSQNRTGTLWCRIAVTFFSLRSLRFACSASWVSEDGKVLAETTTVPESAATWTSSMPPGREATTRASPPSAGSSHSSVSSVWSSSSSAGSGRAEVNSSEPSGRKAAPASPFALRVRRRAGRSPAGSVSQSAVTYLVRLEFSVCTAVTSRVPSGDRVRPAPRGSSM